MLYTLLLKSWVPLQYLVCPKRAFYFFSLINVNQLPVRQTRLNRGNRTGESAIFAPEKSPDQEYLAQ